MASYPQTSFTAPENATRITLVRHGQSEAADPERPFPLKHGHGDPHLTELGRRQAGAVADRLVHEPIDTLYVSSLIRTHQTAEPLAGQLGRTPIEEHDLREVFLGEWEGGVFRHMLAQAEHPAAIEFRRTYEWGSVPGAETNEQLVKRTSAALHRIHDNHLGEHVVAFVHGGVIAALCARATGGQLFGFAGAENASIHRLLITDERWFLRSFNDANHLGALLTPSAAIDQPA
jgi:probable phosphoglycerate mutase